MISRLKNKLQEKWEALVVSRYVHHGLRWGDRRSYAFMGDPYNPHERAFRRWERRYVALGYLPIHPDEWILAGGYVGPKQICNLLRLKSTT